MAESRIGVAMTPDRFAHSRACLESRGVQPGLCLNIEEALKTRADCLGTSNE